MMATVPHVISGLGLTKFQADGFLLTRVYNVDSQANAGWKPGHGSFPLTYFPNVFFTAHQPRRQPPPPFHPPSRTKTTDLWTSKYGNSA